MSEIPSELSSKSDEDRREFLKSCGRFAVVTPPTVTMLLSTSLTSNAIAKSGGGGRGRDKGNNGWGNGADPRNPGSSHGKGESRGGPGAGQSQDGSKTGGGR
ncbi:hypothetical protein [Ensifer aridi]|uniref:hypothetical protein n=1 Tax=Ensifer aridi TaxID=1708715 RepID=UPI000A0F71FC|nr:hypothetical protein [Ensifer aridi]